MGRRDKSCALAGIVLSFTAGMGSQGGLLSRTRASAHVLSPSDSPSSLMNRRRPERKLALNEGGQWLPVHLQTPCARVSTVRAKCQLIVQPPVDRRRLRIVIELGRGVGVHCISTTDESGGINWCTVPPWARRLRRMPLRRGHHSRVVRTTSGPWTPSHRPTAPPTITQVALPCYSSLTFLLLSSTA